jgi:hypothetical protein
MPSPNSSFNFLWIVVAALLVADGESFQFHMMRRAAFSLVPRVVQRQNHLDRSVASSSSSSSSSLVQRWMTTDAPAEKTEEEKAAIKAEREARKAAKEQGKAEKAAKKEAERLAKEEAERIEDVNYLSFEDQDSYEPFGDLVRVMSRSRTGREFANVEDLGSVYKAGKTVWLRGRLHSIRVKGGSCFLVLRQNSFNTVQACFFKDQENPEFSQKMIKYLKSLTVESIIDLEGLWRTQRSSPARFKTLNSRSIASILSPRQRLFFRFWSKMLPEARPRSTHPRRRIVPFPVLDKNYDWITVGWI